MQRHFLRRFGYGSELYGFTLSFAVYYIVSNIVLGLDINIKSLDLVLAALSCIDAVNDVTNCCILVIEFDCALNNRLTCLASSLLSGSLLNGVSSVFLVVAFLAISVALFLSDLSLTYTIPSYHYPVPLRL